MANHRNSNRTIGTLAGGGGEMTVEGDASDGVGHNELGGRASRGSTTSGYSS